jgi:voltage-gated potassium channel
MPGEAGGLTLSAVTGRPARTRAQVNRRRRAVLGIFRGLASTIVLVTLFYVLPLDRLNVPLWVVLTVGLVILFAISAWQLNAVLRARYPAVRAIEALAITVPLFLLLFASAYFVMEKGSPASFTHSLTRTDALYFTVTTFSTVGYGDITPASQTARVVVTVQMLLDLLALGLGIRAFVGAVQLARQQRPAAAELSAPEPPAPEPAAPEPAAPEPAAPEPAAPEPAAPEPAAPEPAAPEPAATPDQPPR